MRGILSPPATSMTYIVRSASSRLKLAAKLSPPDSSSKNSHECFLVRLSSACVPPGTQSQDASSCKAPRVVS